MATSNEPLMSFTEMAREVARQQDCTQAAAHRIIWCFLEMVQEEVLHKHRRVMIRGFGSFMPRHRNTFKGPHGITKPRYRIGFLPGANSRKIANQAVNQDLALEKGE